MQECSPSQAFGRGLLDTGVRAWGGWSYTKNWKKGGETRDVEERGEV